MIKADSRITVNVLTGFLGSGKTTLLRRLLNDQAFSRCAVLMNELGDIALDHELLETIDQETVVLRSGCICCGVRSDMAQALLQLHERRDRGEVPPFDRVVIETTGLADPVPIINTVLGDATLRHHYRVGTVISTVDALMGAGQLTQFVEARRQAAMADRIVITKADLADAALLHALRDALGKVNSHCRVVESRNDATEEQVLMASDLGGVTRQIEVQEWFRAGGDNPMRGAFSGGKGRGGVLRAQPATTHGDIRSCSLSFDEPLDWMAFGVWLSMLLHRHGADILRLKGILNLKGVDVPTVVHGVQHLLHPPTHLDRWPNEERRSRLILIGRLPPSQALADSLFAFNQAACA